MRLRKLIPSFVPLIIEFDTQLEIQLLACISDFLSRNVDARNALKTWYRVYYLHDQSVEEKDVYTSLSLMLLNLKNLSNDRLADNNKEN